MPVADPGPSAPDEDPRETSSEPATYGPPSPESATDEDPAQPAFHPEPAPAKRTGFFAGAVGAAAAAVAAVRKVGKSDRDDPTPHQRNDPEATTDETAWSTSAPTTEGARAESLSEPDPEPEPIDQPSPFDDLTSAPLFYPEPRPIDEETSTPLPTPIPSAGTTEPTAAHATATPPDRAQQAPPTPAPATAPPTSGLIAAPPTSGPNTAPRTSGPTAAPPTPVPAAAPPTSGSAATPTLGPATAASPTPGPAAAQPTSGPAAVPATRVTAAESPTLGPAAEPSTPGSAEVPSHAEALSTAADAQEPAHPTPTPDPSTQEPAHPTPALDASIREPAHPAPSPDVSAQQSAHPTPAPDASAPPAETSTRSAQPGALTTPLPGHPQPSPAAAALAAAAAAAAAQDHGPWADLAGAPTPALASEPDDRTADVITAYPSARPGPAGAIHGVGITVLVTDLDRSTAFYRDTLGFFAIDSGEGSAVLASGDTRLVLRTVHDLSAEVGRLIYLNLEVGDVDAVYRELLGKGVEFVHPPRPVNRGDRLELWSASFRDPDGHNIAITQWRAVH
ncbi:VOC family protein [Actinoplanes sp. URMC 104]|uniref:VOC family protein n=1 Tax=Actinoplanes sp. URMC 104 TaxID=3423409 RepID=UPI003F197C64